MMSDLEKARNFKKGMAPTVWGPIFWATMHIVSLGYPESPTDDQRAGALAFFRSLKTVIPCPICRQHLSKHLETYPIEDAVSSREELIVWVWTLHNNVNRTLNKNEISMDEFLSNMTILSNMNYIQIPPKKEEISRVNFFYVLALLAGLGGLTFLGYQHRQKILQFFHSFKSSMTLSGL